MARQGPFDAIDGWCGSPAGRSVDQPLSPELPSQPDRFRHVSHLHQLGMHVFQLFEPWLSFLGFGNGFPWPWPPSLQMRLSPTGLTQKYQFTGSLPAASPACILATFPCIYMSDQGGCPEAWILISRTKGTHDSISDSARLLYPTECSSQTQCLPPVGLPLSPRAETLPTRSSKCIQSFLVATPLHAHGSLPRQPLLRCNTSENPPGCPSFPSPRV